MHLTKNIINNQLDAKFFFYIVYSNSLHVSSNQVLIIRRVSCINTTSGITCVTICRWPCGMHTTRSPTYSDIYQRSYWYNWLSWWWANSCSKHVEIWNKLYKKKNCVSSWLFIRIVIWKFWNSYWLSGQFSWTISEIQFTAVTKFLKFLGVWRLLLYVSMAPDGLMVLLGIVERMLLK